MLSRIADGVHVQTSSCIATNTIVIEEGSAALVIDPGLTNAEFDARLLEHRGHAVGHAAVLIEAARVLVAGDMLSDVLVPMPDLHGNASDPLGDYLDGLALLESVALLADVVIPGHGSVGDGDDLRARIDADRAYIHALRDGRSIADARVTAPAPGWEWVAFIHDDNVERASRITNERREPI